MAKNKSLKSLLEKISKPSSKEIPKEISKDVKNVTFNAIPSDILRLFRLACFRADKTMRSVITEFMTEYSQKEKQIEGKGGDK